MRRLAKALFPALSVLAAAAVLPVPASAQVGVLDQPWRNDPFQPLLEGRLAVTHYLNAGAENNTLGVGEMVAISHIVPEFRASDIFLLAGLVPEGKGVRVASQGRSALVLAVPAGALTLGFSGGARIIAEAEVPDAVAGLIRDGVEGDVITVELTELGGQVFAFAEAGVNGVYDLPLVPTPMGDLTLVLGAGARYLHGLSHSRFGFDGDEGDATSTFTVARTGVTTELAIGAPLADESLTLGGAGFAVDLMGGLTVGEAVQIRAAVTDLGSATFEVGRRRVSRVVMDDVSILELGTTADSVTATDTLSAGTRDVALPTTFRLDASYRPIDAVGLGARIAAPLGDGPQLEPLLQAGVELRPLRVLPLRFGLTGGGDFGTGFFGGLGLDTRVVRWQIEAGSTGGPGVDEFRGVSFRSELALRF